MRSLQASSLVLGCCLICMNAARATAEIPDMDPARMREIASHVFVGKVAKVYSSSDGPTAEGNEIRSIAEIRVTKVEKGKHEAPLVYVRFANRGRAGNAPVPSGSSGQRGVPKVGATSRVFVITGDDGGFDVLPPNGFASITESRKQ